MGRQDTLQNRNIVGQYPNCDGSAAENWQFSIKIMTRYACCVRTSRLACTKENLKLCWRRLMIVSNRNRGYILWSFGAMDLLRP